MSEDRPIHQVGESAGRARPLDVATAMTDKERTVLARAELSVGRPLTAAEAEEVVAHEQAIEDEPDVHYATTDTVFRLFQEGFIRRALARKIAEGSGENFLVETVDSPKRGGWSGKPLHIYRVESRYIVAIPNGQLSHCFYSIDEAEAHAKYQARAGPPP